MKPILLTLVLLTMCARALSQVTTDSAYLRVAKDEIIAQMTGKHAEIYSSWGHSLADTANIKYILPVYRIPKTYRDSVTSQSTFADMIKIEHTPLNQQIIISNKKGVSVIYYERGFTQEDEEYFIGTPYYDSYKSMFITGTSYSSGFRNFHLGTIKYKQFEKLLRSHPDWSFFLINFFDDLWAFDENHQLLHIRQKGRKLVIENSQSYYQSIVQQVGIETIKFWINPNLPKD